MMGSLRLSPREISVPWPVREHAERFRRFAGSDSFESFDARAPHSAVSESDGPFLPCRYNQAKTAAKKLTGFTSKLLLKKAADAENADRGISFRRSSTLIPPDHHMVGTTPVMMPAALLGVVPLPAIMECHGCPPPSSAKQASGARLMTAAVHAGHRRGP